jgi:hypothetical protein
LATTWIIWWTRNNIVFRGEFVNVTSLVHQIINVAWFRFIGREGRSVNFSFFDLCNNPLTCFHRI